MSAFQNNTNALRVVKLLEPYVCLAFLFLIACIKGKRD